MLDVCCIVLGTIASLFGSDRSNAVASDVRSPVVIVATFSVASSGLPCQAPEIDKAEEYGSQFVGAPCQRKSENLLHPSCWAENEDEDPCFIVSNEGTLTKNGECPDEPCQAELVVDLTFVEPCVPPCPTPKCCSSGVLRITDLVYPLGYLLNGETQTFSAVSDCACTELEDHHCLVVLEVQCEELGSYFYELSEFGYAFHCEKCE